MFNNTFNTQIALKILAVVIKIILNKKDNLASNHHAYHKIVLILLKIVKNFLPTKELQLSKA
jgi:hypothetical protein